MIKSAADNETRNAQFFLQCLYKDQCFRESLARLTSSCSLTEFIRVNGFCFDNNELVKAFIEHMESLSECSDDCNCSLYERGILELL